MNVKPRAKIRAFASIGSISRSCSPRPRRRDELVLLRKAGMSKDDIDLFEINEAFSAVVLRYMRALDLDPAKVNMNGGAIAMGHPLGATGGMILGTVLDELERADKADGPRDPLRRGRHGHGDHHRAGLRRFGRRPGAERRLSGVPREDDVLQRMRARGSGGQEWQTSRISASTSTATASRSRPGTCPAVR